MKKFRPIEDDVDVTACLQRSVKTRGHSQKTVQKNRLFVENGGQAKFLVLQA
jgi:hypothetical protein